VQIIALLHHIWFIIYKCLLSIAQRFKGPSQRKFRLLSTKMEFKCRTIKVNVSKTKLYVQSPFVFEITYMSRNVL